MKLHQAYRPIHKSQALVWSRAMHNSPHIYIRHNRTEQCQKCVRPSCVCISGVCFVSVSLNSFTTWGFCCTINRCWRNIDEGRDSRTSLKALVTHYNESEGGGECQIKSDIVSLSFTSLSVWGLCLLKARSQNRLLVLLNKRRLD